MWNDGHLICEQAYRRPVKEQSIRRWWNAGEDASLIWTPLMEVYIGKGSILASQLAIVSHWKTEPMAAEMLLRMLAYLDQPVYRSPQTRLAIVGEASESVKNRLAEIRTNISKSHSQATCCWWIWPAARNLSQPSCASMDEVKETAAAESFTESVRLTSSGSPSSRQAGDGHGPAVSVVGRPADVGSAGQSAAGGPQ